MTRPTFCVALMASSGWPCAAIGSESLRLLMAPRFFLSRMAAAFTVALRMAWSGVMPRRREA